MILNYFEDLTSIDGTEAVLIIDKTNKLIEKWTIPHFNTKIFKDLGLQILQMMAVAQNQADGSDEITILHEKNLVYARDFGKLVLIVIAKLRVEMTLLRLITNVSWAESMETKKIEKQIKKFPTSCQELLREELLDDVESHYLEKMTAEREEEESE